MLRGRQFAGSWVERPAAGLNRLFPKSVSVAPVTAELGSLP